MTMIVLLSSITNINLYLGEVLSGHRLNNFQCSVQVKGYSVKLRSAFPLATKENQ